MNTETFKFRITYSITLRDSPEVSEVVFQYYQFKVARKNYKTILHELYRRRYVESFKICLNRCHHPKWQKAIFEESVRT